MGSVGFCDRLPYPPGVSDEPVSAEELASLRAAMGWPAVSPDAARQCIREACFVWGAREADGGLLGLVRVVGDGVLTFYIADLLVHPEARGLPTAPEAQAMVAVLG